MLIELPQEIIRFHIIPYLDTKSLLNFGYTSKTFKKLIHPLKFREIFTYILNRDLAIFEKYEKIFGITYISPWFHISKTSLNVIKNTFRIKTSNGINELMNINDIVELVCSKLEKSKELRQFTYGNIQPLLALNVRITDTPIYEDQFRYSSSFSPLKIVNMYHEQPPNMPPIYF